MEEKSTETNVNQAAAAELPLLPLWILLRALIESQNPRMVRVGRDLEAQLVPGVLPKAAQLMKTFLGLELAGEPYMVLLLGNDRLSPHTGDSKLQPDPS